MRDSFFPNRFARAQPQRRPNSLGGMGAAQARRTSCLGMLDHSRLSSADNTGPKQRDPPRSARQRPARNAEDFSQPTPARRPHVPTATLSGMLLPDAQLKVEHRRRMFSTFLSNETISTVNALRVFHSLSCGSRNTLCINEKIFWSGYLSLVMTVDSFSLILFPLICTIHEPPII